MRLQIKERFSSSALDHLTRFSTMQVERNYINPETIERLARELADARAVVEAARTVLTADRQRTSDLQTLHDALNDYYGEEIR